MADIGVGCTGFLDIYSNREQQSESKKKSRLPPFKSPKNHAYAHGVTDNEFPLYRQQNKIVTTVLRNSFGNFVSKYKIFFQVGFPILNSWTMMINKKNIIQFSVEYKTKNCDG